MTILIIVSNAENRTGEVVCLNTNTADSLRGRSLFSNMTCSPATSCAPETPEGKGGRRWMGGIISSVGITLPQHVAVEMHPDVMIS